jgi:hypothetical protein
MNRRQFIKASIPAVALPAIAITCKYEDDEKGPKKESMWKRWDYRVYCYERGQGEWTFSQNIKGSFAHQREYMTFNEENDLSWNPHYASGWMDGGKLHFSTLDDATDFVDIHARTKDDVNLIDSILPCEGERSHKFPIFLLGLQFLLTDHLSVDLNQVLICRK